MSELVFSITKALAFVATPTALKTTDEYYPNTYEELMCFMVSHDDMLIETFRLHVFENTKVGVGSGSDMLLDFMEYYELVEHSDVAYCEEYASSYRTYVYRLAQEKHEEYNYINLLKTILKEGDQEREDRTNVGTCSIFGPQIEFDISRSIPVLTTKFLPWKMVLKELLWFLKGHTDSLELEAQGVPIWKGNSTREFLDQRGLQHYAVGDIGPMYGYNWRHWGHTYEGCQKDYTGAGYDQLEHLIEAIKRDPFSRRHLLTTYNPSEVAKSVLAPCHGVSTIFYVTKNKGEGAAGQNYLSCKVVCRSSDSFLGLPFNIASYAMMTYIIAMKCDLKPLKLIVSMGDAHIYNNHMSQVGEQLGRKPFPFPILKMNETIRDKDCKDIQVSDFDLVGYLYHPTIKAPMAV